MSQQIQWCFFQLHSEQMAEENATDMEDQQHLFSRP